MALKDTLHWRYATKSYNGDKVAQEKIDPILEAIRLAPSSSGLQPFKVLIILNSTHKCNAHPCMHFVRRLPAQALARA